jgi:5-methylcytosine-specific restriction endonuclease McrA
MLAVAKRKEEGMSEGQKIWRGVRTALKAQDRAEQDTRRLVGHLRQQDCTELDEETSDETRKKIKSESRVGHDFLILFVFCAVGWNTSRLEIGFRRDSDWVRVW